VLVSYEGQIKIVDFGIAKARESARTVERPGEGQVHLLFSEQARGKELDARTDVFAAGSCSTRWCGGRLPFAGR